MINMHDNVWWSSIVVFHLLRKLHSMKMHCYMIYIKTWVFLENPNYSLNIEDIFTKFTGHPMNWINMMSSKGQVYAKKTVYFISKKEGPVYFEQHCIISTANKLQYMLRRHCWLVAIIIVLATTFFTTKHNHKS